MNLTLALANPTQIRNGITKLFGESGKPELGRLKLWTPELSLAGFVTAPFVVSEN
jgi:hypothetical protein